MTAPTLSTQTHIAVVVGLVTVLATVGLAVGVWLAGRRDRGRS
jgi:hypothetical protein